MRTSGLQWNREKKNTHTHTQKQTKKEYYARLGKIRSEQFLVSGLYVTVTIKLRQILKVHFTVTGGNKAGVDFVLIVKATVTKCKHVVLTQTTVNFYTIIFITKRRRFVYQNKVNLNLNLAITQPLGQ